VVLPWEEVDDGGEEEDEVAAAWMWCWAKAIHWRSRLFRAERLRLRLFDEVGLMVAPVAEADDDSVATDAENWT